MTKVDLIATATFATLLAVSSASARTISAPGGHATAIIESGTEGDCEAVITVTGRSDENIGRHDYRSRDHQNGECVGVAEWTKDGSFLVVSLYNSGGHQPWAGAIDIFSVSERKFVTLQDHVADTLTDDPFLLVEPHGIDFWTTKSPDDKATKRRVDLTTLFGR